jgi:methylated-DNA-[protein]-cysteine S-methyltransferase
MNDSLQYCIFDTAIGPCGIAWSREGVVRFLLPDRSAAATEAGLRQRTGAASPSEPPESIAEAIAALRRYFDGGAMSFDQVPVALPPLEEFQQRVYAATRALGWGKTATYGEIAKIAGLPNGAQAVGQAMSRNPVPIIIPCHRVLAAGGKVGGFSAYGGGVTKARLLAMEGVFLDDNQPSLPGL